jgi:enoyl-CoA hydratase/carnithine racemase
MTNSQEPVFFTSHCPICEIRFKRPEKLNALRHPLGATSGQSVGKAATSSSARASSALATQCTGGRMGIAMILEAA